ncbi:unnamed protein product [Adineta steineri]|uniref:LTD domain-containing protein n=1 Tax=Adineta steineri TaxID=433720 RepID=A0A814D8D8_9BILA|nr:unnamed protein product [Adineta steineri]CAF1056783.1 unnamed protein product [Adineta steineri]CAF1087246.1 unnamed protein product [Adineta steineri]CAF3642425.1 unnamed protein product [Adineta steineri]
MIDDDIDNEELTHTKTVFRRHSKGSVMFSGCSPSGDVIVIDNISSTKSYDLTGWYIERQTDAHSFLRYTFTNNFIIPPWTTIELWSSSAANRTMPNDVEYNQSSKSIEKHQEQQQQQQSFVRVKTKLLTWNTGLQWSINRLMDSNGHERAIFTHRTLTSIEQEKEE